MWIIPIDGDERRRATRRRPTCAHERRIHPLPLPALRVDPLSASARLRVEVHLHPSDERPPHKLGGRPRRVQVATQGEPVLQGAADEHENAGRSARSVPAVRQVGEAAPTAIAAVVARFVTSPIAARPARLDVTNRGGEN